MILQTKKLDEVFIFSFITIYFIFGLSIKLALFFIITYSILRFFSKSVDDMINMSKNGFYVSNESLAYSKYEKARLYICLPLIVFGLGFGLGFGLTFCMIFAYVVFIATFIHEKKHIFK